jgi:tetratricopeptide (TPR) repeat protein
VHKVTCRQAVARALVLAAAILLMPSSPASPAPAPPATTTTQQTVASEKSAPPKGALETAATWTTAARTAVLDILVILILAVFARGTWDEMRSRAVVIDPIEVPADLSELGYTPVVIAQWIQTEIAELRRRARARGSLEEGFTISASQVDFTVPSAGVSFRNVIRFIRQIVGRPEERVRGEIVRFTRNVKQAPAFLPDDVGDGDLALPNGESTSPQLRLTLRTRDGRTTPKHLTVTSAEDLPTLIQRAAYELSLLTDPYTVALYWASKEQESQDFTKTMSAIRHCIKTTPASLHHKAYVVWGNALAAQRDFPGAEKKFEYALTLEKRSPSAYVSRGNVCRTTRRPELAAKNYRKGASLDSKDTAARNGLGYSSNDRFLYAKAIRHFRRTLRIDPRNANAYNGMAFALWRMGKVEEAEAGFVRAMELDPGYHWPRRNLALVRRSQHRFAEAIDLLKVAAADHSVAFDAYSSWADILFDLGENAEAAAKIELAIAQNPKIAMERATRARLLLRQHRYSRSIRDAELTVASSATGLPLVILGDALRREGRIDEAIDAYRRALRVDPWLSWLYNSTAQALRRRGEYRESLLLARRGTRIDPADSFNWIGLGDALLAMHKYTSAEKAYRRAAEVDPTNAAAHYASGRVRLAMGRLDSAAAHLRRAATIAPELAWCVAQYADTLLLLNQPEAAVAEFEKAIAIHPRLGSLRNEYARLLLKLHRVTEASASCEQSLTLDANDADAMVILADIDRRFRRFGRASERLRKAITADRAHDGVRRLLISALHESGRSRTANRMLRRWVHEEPHRTNALLEVGDSLRRQGRYAAALTKYHQAADKHPFLTGAWLSLASLQRTMHRPEDAIASLKRASAVDPYDPAPHRQRGRALMAMHRHREAMAAFQKAARLRPHEPESYYAMGDLHEIGGRPEEALRLYRKAARLDPRFVPAIEKISQLLIDLGEGEQALTEIEEAVQALPEVPDIHSAAARILGRLRKWDRMLASYRNALRLRPADSSTLTSFANFLPNRHVESKRRILRMVLRADAAHESAFEHLAASFDIPGGESRAWRWYARGARLAPYSTAIRIAWASSLLLAAERTNRDDLLDAAEEKLREVISLDRWQTGARRRLGRLLLERGRPEKALAEIDALLRFDRRDPYAWLDRSNVLRELKRHRAALKAAKRAAVIRPRYTAAKLAVAELLLHFDRRAEALSEANDVLAFDPDNEEAAALIESLKEAPPAGGAS